MRYSKRWMAAICFTGVCGVMVSLASAEMWEAQPITVHEWGVQQFDWSSPTTRPGVVLPAFIHTDVNPGDVMPAPAKRVKDMPPDSGMRDKPVLYFYAPNSDLGQTVVGVEMRFQFGEASAWYPQANVYRTAEMTAGGKEPDWVDWKKAHPRWGNDPKKLSPVPDDPRMQLAWYSLTLTKDLPANMKLAGDDLPADHWIKTAREVPSAYINNGKDAEKFLFYEGKTLERPVIAIVPDRNAFHVVNVTDETIYNVMAVYRSGDHVWIGYVSSLPPVKVGGNPSGGGDTIASLPIPVFANFTQWTDPKSLASVTTERLVNALAEGGSLTINNTFRDPADPQGSTTSGTLFPEEAAALEKIWHKDFFESEGLTIVYRESPASLDKAMPLSIYTDMFHYVALSRCGLVLNKNIDLQVAREVFYATYSAGTPNGGDKSMALLLQYPILARSAIFYQIRLGRDVERYRALHTLLEQLHAQ